MRGIRTPTASSERAVPATCRGTGVHSQKKDLCASCSTVGRRAAGKAKITSSPRELHARRIPRGNVWTRSREGLKPFAEERRVVEVLPPDDVPHNVQLRHNAPPPRAFPGEGRTRRGETRRTSQRERRNPLSLPPKTAFV